MITDKSKLAVVKVTVSKNKYYATLSIGNRYLADIDCYGRDLNTIRTALIMALRIVDAYEEKPVQAEFNGELVYPMELVNKLYEICNNKD